MRRGLFLLVFFVYLGLLTGCGSNAASTPDKIPPMPKGDKPGNKPDAGGSIREG